MKEEIKTGSEGKDVRDERDVRDNRDVRDLDLEFTEAEIAVYERKFEIGERFSETLTDVLARMKSAGVKELVINPCQIDIRFDDDDNVFTFLTIK
jgi:hypothetical protein